MNTQVSKFDIPEFGVLIGNVLTGVLSNALKGLGLGDVIKGLGLGNLLGAGLGTLTGLGGLGGLLGLAAPAAANAVPASVQKSLAAGSTVTAKDNKLTASSTAAASG